VRTPSPRIAFLALLAWPVLALADGPGPEEPRAGSAAEAIEEIDDVAEVGPAPAPVAVPDGPVAVVGKLHPALVHLPIGWLVMVLLLDFGAFVFRREAFEQWGVWALGATFLAALPAVATGLLREDAFGSAPAETARLVSTHRTLMLAMTSATAVALALRLARRNRLRGAWKAAYLVFALAAVGLVIVGGHWGGKIVFGADHLPF